MSETSLDKVIRLTTVTVPAHERRDHRTGRKEHVDTYTYERHTHSKLPDGIEAHAGAFATPEPSPAAVQHYRKAASGAAKAQYSIEETRSWLDRHPISAKNIVDMYDQATPGEKDSGRKWYPNAHAIAQSMADQYGVSLREAAGMIATYSPQTGLARNLLEANEVERTRIPVGGPGAHVNIVKTPNDLQEARYGIMASGANRSRAAGIMAGKDFEDVFAGKRNKNGSLPPKALKIRAFGELIARGGQDPTKPVADVVVDRHAAGVARGVRFGDDDYAVEGPSSSQKKYAVYSKAYRDAASQLSKREGRKVTPEEVQAVTWLTRQRLNGSNATVRKIAARANREAWNYFASYDPNVADILFKNLMEATATARKQPATASLSADTPAEGGPMTESASDRLELTRVVVPPHDRTNPKTGRKEHVEGYTYERRSRRAADAQAVVGKFNRAAGTARPGTIRGTVPPAKAKDQGTRILDASKTGRPRPPAAGSVDDPIDVRGNLDDAVTYLSQGLHVRLNQPDQVTLLADKVNDIVKQAKANGGQVPNINLCEVSVPGTNLFCHDNKGIPRIKMPQLTGVPRPGTPAYEHRDAKGKADITAAFKQSLIDKGIKVTNKRVKAIKLRATQDELDGAKVSGMSAAIRAGTMKEGSIFISKDNYVIDGHHRWAANVVTDAADDKLGDVTMPVVQVDMEIGQILDYANWFATQQGIQAQSMSTRTVKLSNPNCCGPSSEEWRRAQTTQDDLDESSLDKVVRLAMEDVSSYTRRGKNGQTQRVHQYVRRGEIGMGMGAKKGVFSHGDGVPSAAPTSVASKVQTKVKTVETGAKRATSRAETRALNKAKRVEAGVERARAKAKAKAEVLRTEHDTLDEKTREKVIKEGANMSPQDRQALFDSVGLELKYKDLTPAKLDERWHLSNDDHEKADIEDDLAKHSQIAGLSLAIKEHANREVRLSRAKTEIEQKAVWDHTVSKFGKPGEALLKLRDKFLDSTLNEKVLDPAKKAAERAADFAKDVAWRYAEIYLSGAMFAGVLHASHVILQNPDVAEHLGRLGEGHVGEAVVGATTAVIMGLSIKIAKKMSKKGKDAAVTGAKTAIARRAEARARKGVVPKRAQVEARARTATSLPARARTSLKRATGRTSFEEGARPFLAGTHGARVSPRRAALSAEGRDAILELAVAYSDKRKLG